MVQKLWHKMQKFKKHKCLILYKITKNGNGNICVLCHNFWTNHNLDQLSTSKWPSQPQFCEKWTYLWKKMTGNGRKIVIYQYLSFRSDYIYPHHLWFLKLQLTIATWFNYVLQLGFLHFWSLLIRCECLASPRQTIWYVE